MAINIWDLMNPQPAEQFNPAMLQVADVPTAPTPKAQKAISKAAQTMAPMPVPAQMPEMPMSELQQFEQAFAKNINQREMNNAEMNKKLQQMMSERPEGFQAMNLKPMMAFADNLTGSNMSQSYTAPTAVKDWEGKISKLQDSIAKENNALSDDQLGFLKAKAAEAGADKRLQMSMAAMDKKATREQQSAANGLRGEWLKNPMTKATQDVAVAYEKVESAAANPSAAGDLSLIFGYMKMLDPGSTVREGEFANAQNAAGVPDQIVNMYNRAKSGQRLNPNQRKDFINQAKNVYEGQLAQQERFDQSFYDLASRSGVAPQDVVLKELFARKPKKVSSAAPSSEPDFDSMSDEELRKYMSN